MLLRHRTHHLQPKKQSRQQSRPTLLRATGQMVSAAPAPACAPLVGAEAGSFAEDTITKRLPAILETTRKDILAAPGPIGLRDEIAGLAASVAALRAEIMRLGPVSLPEVPLSAASGAPAALAESVKATRKALTSWQERTLASGTEPTWLSLPWLLIECAMYTHLAVACAEQPALTRTSFDMFALAKAAGWSKCVGVAADLALATQHLHTRLKQHQQQGGTPAGAAAREADLCLALAEVMQYSLWGNKADLSLSVDAASMVVNTASSSSSSSSAGKQQDGSLPSNPHVIVDEFARVWPLLAPSSSSSSSSGDVNLKGKGRVDVVLDNSGLELFCDLLLADFLITQGLASQVVLHGKPLPWFVSDTLRSDLDLMVEQWCHASSPVPQALLQAKGGDAAAAEEAWAPVRELGARWRQHLDSGAWQWRAHWFWVTPHPFCHMQHEAPDLYGDLALSHLVILKGDLNYRKLVHDCRWPSTTPFSTALQGFSPAPLLSLRTLKADVVVGLQPGQAESLTVQDKQWLVNGKWGMVQTTA